MASTILYKTAEGFTLTKGSTADALVGIFAYSKDSKGAFSKVKRGENKPGGVNVYFVPNDGVRLSDAETYIRRGKNEFTKEEGFSIGVRISLSGLGKFVEI